VRRIFSTKRGSLIRTWLKAAPIALLVCVLWLAITSNGNAVVHQTLTLSAVLEWANVQADDPLLAWRRSAFRL
jgi:hypothetical protein